MALARATRIVKSVLFVCTGNICRSPIAEGLFRRLLGNRKNIEIASAGVHAVRGQPPSLYAVQVCEEEGVDISGLRSQPLSAALIDQATHIFAMTGAHLETIQTLFPDGAEKSFLLREFEEQTPRCGATCQIQSLLVAMFTKSAPAPSKTLYRVCLRS